MNQETPATLDERLKALRNADPEQLKQQLADELRSVQSVPLLFAWQDPEFEFLKAHQLAALSSAASLIVLGSRLDGIQGSLRLIDKSLLRICEISDAAEVRRARLDAEAITLIEKLKPRMDSLLRGGSLTPDGPVHPDPDDDEQEELDYRSRRDREKRARRAILEALEMYEADAPTSTPAFMSIERTRLNDLCRELCFRLGFEFPIEPASTTSPATSQEAPTS